MTIQQRTAQSWVVLHIGKYFPTVRKSHAMLADPQSVTVATVAKSLPRVSSGDYSGVFENTVEGLTLRVSHKKGPRNRSTARLDHQKTAADPLLPSNNRPYSMSCYLVIDVPNQGYSTTEVAERVQALIDWLDTAANLNKVLGLES